MLISITVPFFKGILHHWSRIQFYLYLYSNGFCIWVYSFFYVMLCCFILFYFILCYVMLCYVMLCYVMLCYVMLCYVMLFCFMLCYVFYLFYFILAVGSNFGVFYIKQYTKSPLLKYQTKWKMNFESGFIQRLDFCSGNVCRLLHIYSKILILHI